MYKFLCMLIAMFLGGCVGYFSEKAFGVWWPLFLPISVGLGVAGMHIGMKLDGDI